METRDVCKEAGGYVSMPLFEKLMSGEEGYIDFLETQLEPYDRIGAQNYEQLNASKIDEGDG